MKKEISSELNEALKYNLSFAGCGFLGIYHGEIRKSFPREIITKMFQTFSCCFHYSRCCGLLQEICAAVVATENLGRFGRSSSGDLSSYGDAIR